MENLLSSLAFLDARHDFGSLADTYKNTISESLPGQIINIPNEDAAIDIASTYAENVNNIYFETSTPDDIFATLGGSATTPIAIVCDASFCSNMIRKLETNNIGKVYFIRNREVIMDAGTNKKITETGNLYMARDIEKETILYSRHVRPENNYEHTFKELHSTLDVTIENEEEGFLLTTIDDNIIESYYDYEADNDVPNIANTISNSTSSDATSSDEIKSCFLRKRSGDLATGIIMFR